MRSGSFSYAVRYATSCTLQMTLKAAALVMVVSGAVKFRMFRMARVGSLGKGKRRGLGLGPIPDGSTVVALHGMGPSWRGHLALVCLTWPGQCF
jgi:hypothetical protein